VGDGGGGSQAGGGCDSDSEIDKPIGARTKDVNSRKPPAKRSRPGSGKGHKRSSGPAEVGGAATVAVDPDDTPLFSQKSTKCLNKDQQELRIEKEVWSYEFAAGCAHLLWYESNRGNTASYHAWLMKEKDTAVFHSNDGHPLEVTITRRPSPLLKKLLGLKRAHGSCPVEVSDHDVEIKFEVRANSGRNYYLMYHDYAGVVMVKLEKIMKPNENDDLVDDDKWGETMSFRRVFDTPDAVNKAKHQQDNGIYMGELAMREVLRKEKANVIAPTVHEGDCTYLGDIRTLVGVVRWKKEGMNDLPKDYFSENRTDLVLTGGSVSQNVSK
jgi:hypothetical protein